MICSIPNAIAQNATAQTATQALSLENALAMLPNSPGWHLADLNYQLAQRQLEAAKAAASLQVSGGGKYDHNTISSTGLAQDSASLSATASLGVLPWSASFDAVRNAERSLIRASLDLRDARNQLRLNTIAQYSALRLANVDATNAKQSEQLNAALYDIGQKQLAAGQITREQLLARSQTVETARNTTLQSFNAVQLAQLQLANTLGQNLGPTQLSTTGNDLAIQKLADQTTLIKTALSQRSDVLQAQSRVEDAQDALNNARRDRLLPSANFSAGYNDASGLGLNAGINLGTGNATLGTNYTILPSNSNSSYSFAASLSIPILAPGADAKINTAVVNLEMATQILENTNRAAELDVQQKLLDANLAEAKVQTVQTSFEAASSAFKTASARNDAGLNTNLDVESARLTVLQSGRDLENAKWNAVLAAYKLELAIGTTNIFGGKE